jgi:hypothetical protein
MIWTLLFVLALLPGVQAETRVAVVVDTSGSMDRNDQPRYASLASLILGDLLDDDAAYQVNRLAEDERNECLLERPKSSLSRTLDPRRRSSSKQQIDRLLNEYDDGNHFCSPVRSAIEFLGESPDDPRLLLFVGDAHDFGEGKQILRDEIAELGRTGALVGTINLTDGGDVKLKGAPFDQVEYARTPQEIIYGLAEVYQRFVGSQQVKKGSAGSTTDVEIDPYVGRAFFVVAADGQLPPPTIATGAPGAKAIDTDYRGGGIVEGFDAVNRSYRIVRLDTPRPGTWRFQLPAGIKQGGWMLIQEYAIGLRVPDLGTIPKDTEIPLRVELIDTTTGKRITNHDQIPDLAITLDEDGRVVTLSDDGTNGDDVPNDGVFSVPVRFDRAGEVPLRLRLRTKFSDKTTTFMGKVIESPFRIQPDLPTRVELGQEIDLAAQLIPNGSGLAIGPPERISVDVGIELTDDGVAPDVRAGDKRYQGSWKPGQMGRVELVFSVPGMPTVMPVTATVEVVGKLIIDQPPAIELGELHRGQSGEGMLDLSTATVVGRFVLEARCPFTPRASQMEIQQDGAWVPLARGTELVLTDVGVRAWPVRVQVETCPEAFEGPTSIEIRGEDASGAPVSISVPVQVEVVPDPWLSCYWWIPAGALLILVLAWYIHGWMWPSSFSRLMVVWVSAEEDIDEGVPIPIRSVKGSRKRWRRHARVFVCMDFSVRGRAQGAIVRLEADGERVRITPMSGTILRLDDDGEWVPISETNPWIMFGQPHRNEDGSVYFELRRSL